MGFGEYAWKMYFNLPDETRWQPIFRETLVEDKDVVVEI